MKSEPPKNNHLKYYFGYRMSDGATIVTTSSNELSKFIGVSRTTISIALNKSKCVSNARYTIGVTDQIVRQNKGDRRTFRKNTDKYKQYVEQALQYYKENKEADMSQ